MSWKTTVCGALALIGGLLAQFFPQFANAGHFMMALGTGLTGLFARDHAVTDEQASGGQAKGPGLGGVRLLLFLAVLAPLALAPALVGCKATPQKAVYNAVAVPSITAEQALKAWNDYCTEFSVPVAEQIKVKVAYEKYQAAALLAVDAAHAAANAMGSTNSVATSLAAQLTGQNASQALSDLVNLLQTLGVKL